LYPIHRGLLVLALGSLWFSAVAAQQAADRRERREPGLVLTTSGRLGSCDALEFSRDGQFLLATGDDKFVTQWVLTPRQELELAHVPYLRWSVWREQRGAIYAMAFSPDREQRYVAIAGLGVKEGLVAVLDRTTGKTHRVMTEIQSGVNHTIWAITFSPNGKQVAYGGDDGSIWLWDLDKKASTLLGQYPNPTKERFNKIRLITYQGEKQLLTLSQRGELYQWDLTEATPKPKSVFRFKVPNIFLAILSPDGKWIAAASDGYQRVEVRSLDGTTARHWDVPRGQFPHSLAFHPQSTHVAVGTRTIPTTAKFFKELGGQVLIYDLNNEEAAPQQGPCVGLRAERLAFHPKGDLLAVAGGDNHEITLWNLQGKKPKLLQTVCSQGRAVWSVTASPEGRFLGFKQEKLNDPPSVNNRAKEGPWRVFDLHNRQFTTASKLKDELKPLETYRGWSVEPSSSNAHKWFVVGPQGQRQELPWDPVRDEIPWCYSFLPTAKDKPVRLAVGHYWGVWIYELGGATPQRARLLRGHAGEVTCLVPSLDGKILYTGSRDQTIAAWSLVDWPTHPELGASFVLRANGMEVQSVDPGSPAWEAGLTAGDQVLLLAYAGKKVQGGPEAWIKTLENLQPGKECYFRLQKAGMDKPVDCLTTVRQRPLWRFFATTTGEWVLWRYRDYFYDCSTNGDYFVGWQVNGELNETPAFYKAEQFRERFRKPDKVADLVVKGIVEPESVALAKIEPPQVTLTAEKTTVRREDFKVTLSILPHGDGENLQPEQVLVWVNDYLVKEWRGNPGSSEQTLTIPHSKLRRGTNVLVAQCYNKARSRGEANRVYVELETAPERPKLYGVFVGVGKYTKSNPRQRELSADLDAQALLEAWNAQKSTLYADSEMKILTNEEATPEAILQQLHTLAKKVGPDDRLILSLGGHGISADELNAFIKEGKIDVVDKLAPKSYAFVGPFFDVRTPNKTGLTGKDIYEAIIQLPCHKVILLDACHSGSIKASPVRELTRDGIGPLILTACNEDESAIEFSEADLLKRANGLFTLAVIMAMNEDFEAADLNKDNRLDARELAAYIPTKVEKMVQQLAKDKIAGLEDRKQTPQIFPANVELKVELIGKGS
jgi:WD40 repeat protein